MGESSLREILLDDNFVTPHLYFGARRKRTSWSGRIMRRYRCPEDSWSRGRRRHCWIVGSHGQGDGDVGGLGSDGIVTALREAGDSTKRIECSGSSLIFFRGMVEC